MFLALESCELRKGFEGLQALVNEVLKEDLRSGALFVFCNRRRTHLKVLYWDGTGLWLLIKRRQKHCGALHASRMLGARPRKFPEAKEQAPRQAGWMLRQIGHLYRIEAHLREQLEGARQPESSHP